MSCIEFSAKKNEINFDRIIHSLVILVLFFDLDTDGTE